MDPTAHARRIIIVSDATGETARQIIRAALIQFTERVAITLYKNVRNEDQVKAICDEAQVNHALVVHTIVSAQLRKYFNQTAMDHKIPVVDLLGPLLSMYPRHKPGFFMESAKVTSNALRPWNSRCITMTVRILKALKMRIL